MPELTEILNTGMLDIVYVYYMPSCYQASIFGKNRVYYIQIFMVVN